MIYQQEIQAAKSNYQKNKSFFTKLKSKKKNLDDLFHDTHDLVFEEISCIECANCCKTTSPIFNSVDIERLAKHLKVKVEEFIGDYLKIDDEGDYVLKSSPCPFLLHDNHCMVYDKRPKACREYPHTNRKRIHQILGLTLNNSLICPAVSRIIDRLQSQFT